MHNPRRFRLWSSQSGFTLIELLGVMVIVLLLSLMAVTLFLDITDKARRSASSGKLTEVEKALERYQVEKGHYPGTLAQLITEGYIRAPQHASESVRYAAFASPWYDSPNKYMYYAVNNADRPTRFVLVDPITENCALTGDSRPECIAQPNPTQPYLIPQARLASNLPAGWRSSGKLTKP